jgi:catechol 2,3-dioxygenase-like lactoylglutathione lyase family enzyme
MQKRNVFMDVMVKRFVRATRIPAVHPPRIPPTCASDWSGADPALNTFIESVNQHRPGRRGIGPFWALTARALAVLAFISLAAAGRGAVSEVGTIGLTVSDLGSELNFFTNTLPFELVSVSEKSGQDEDALLGLNRVKLRVAELKLGHEHITLTEHLASPGKPIPTDSRSYDRWFQHIAIVVNDMDKAYERLRAHNVRYVSTEPQTLPVWNKNAAGIKAFYFRDPENHVLEIIFFPPGKGDSRWQQPTTKLFLGIDHTAIVVSDTDQSLAFYRDILGMRVAGGSENYGVEQEHLNQVFGARVRITTLRAEHGPGIEFLEYLTPSGGRTLPKDAKANDLIFWTTHLAVNDAAGLSSTMHQRGIGFVSRSPKSHSAQIVRDPDGHALELDQENDGMAQK